MGHRVVGMLLAGSLLLPGAALAATPSHWSGSVDVTSRYMSRGFDQSWHSPALQAGAEYADNGWFVGTWASTVSKHFIEDATFEWDTYAGYRGNWHKWRYTGGIYYYAYPGAKVSATGTRYNYGEAIVGIGRGPIDVSYGVTYTHDYFGYNSKTLGIGQGKHSRGSGYLSVDGHFPLGKHFNLSLHYGHQSVRHFHIYSWTDASVGVDTTWHGLNFALAYARAWNHHGVYRHYTTGVPDKHGHIYTSNPISGRYTLTVSHAF